MEFADLLQRRRMRRNYTDQPVPPEVLERVLHRASRHPSAGFSQGVHFLVVTDAVRRHQLAQQAGEDAYRQRGFDPWLSRAPVHVYLTTREAAYHERYAETDKGGSSQQWEVPYWHVDAGAAFMLLLLAAVDEGLAAGFQGGHRLRDLTLGLPPDVTLVGLVTLGYPAPDRRSTSAQRPRQDVVHWERW